MPQSLASYLSLFFPICTVVPRLDFLATSVTKERQNLVRIRLKIKSTSKNFGSIFKKSSRAGREIINPSFLRCIQALSLKLFPRAYAISVHHTKSPSAEVCVMVNNRVSCISLPTCSGSVHLSDGARI